MKAALFQLMQWKHAVRLEAEGIKIARRSVRTHAARALGLGPRTEHATVVAHLDWIINEAKRLNAGLTTIIELDPAAEPTADDLEQEARENRDRPYLRHNE